MSAEATEQKSGGFKAKVQTLGSYLSGMIMPNIAAFIAWGFITALFIEDGWLPNEGFAQLVDPMINYLLPILIAFTGGRMVHGLRGGVIGATAVMGVIVGADIPMFLGAMVMGPLGGYLMKLIDKFFEDKIPSGFEMLINNFTGGFLGLFLALFGNAAVGPVVSGLTNTLAAGVQWLVNLGLLPLTSIIIEPAKVLFLNNAINHGILSPLGASEASEMGSSILFMLETNPGPGLGVLLAFIVFGSKLAKGSAAGASVIHFVGGIHEIYFPYILMKPMLLLAVIGGGMSGVFTFVIFDVGLAAVPSPGSIIAYALMTPQGDHFGVMAGIFVATAVSFLISAVILKTTGTNEENLDEATTKMEAMKGKESSAAEHLRSQTREDVSSLADVEKIVFACDAGMGSSAMGASVLRKKVKQAGLDVEVINTSISQIPDDADLIVTHQDLTERAEQQQPDKHHVSVENFMKSERYDEIVEEIKENK
ncbi:PTS system mannitol-specific IIC component [Salsuginibacillus halophilus]|uniref:PTS system mannitol-specific EIICB component n=1 Tax=Salsuginibacillus halophilus TaxID=517424 RepID=A0A2P8HI56_9BACI|nr:PTS mannitol transporter subunit IICB [Salsuginibacillus halophilus]PSL45891.1 PTS system mannitol-specific IIC component [Salsuginibacillus halophilus]